jgi:hypothetical protein
MARPSKVTDSLIEQFCSILRYTWSIETTIKKTGIGRASFYRWKQRVSQGKGTPMEGRFIREVDMVEGGMKLVMEVRLAQHFDEDWRAIAWWLERKYPQEYGRRKPLPLPDRDHPE